MRSLAAAAFAVIGLGALPALGQSQPTVLTPDSSTIAVPPAPLIVASPPTPPSPATPPIPPTPATSATPPGLVQAMPPDTAGSPDNTDTGAAPAQDQEVIPTPANTWQPGKTAEIGILDKVDGGVKEIVVPVGGHSVVGDLQVEILACVSRPPDQVPDAAVFLALQSIDNPTAPPNYRGWLIRSAPGAAVAGDASEIFRVIACS